MKEINQTIFISMDGKAFTEKSECKSHEDGLKTAIQKVVDKAINNTIDKILTFLSQNPPHSFESWAQFEYHLKEFILTKEMQDNV